MDFRGKPFLGFALDVWCIHPTWTPSSCEQVRLEIVHIPLGASFVCRQPCHCVFEPRGSCSWHADNSWWSLRMIGIEVQLLGIQWNTPLLRWGGEVPCILATWNSQPGETLRKASMPTSQQAINYSRVKIDSLGSRATSCSKYKQQIWFKPIPEQGTVGNQTKHVVTPTNIGQLWNEYISFAIFIHITSYHFISFHIISYHFISIIPSIPWLSNNFECSPQKKHRHQLRPSGCDVGEVRAQVVEIVFVTRISGHRKSAEATTVHVHLTGPTKLKQNTLW